MVESVQRHSERDSVPTDYSLAGIDLKRVQHTLSEIIQRNKERWKELSVQGVCSQCGDGDNVTNSCIHEYRSVYTNIK